MCTNDDIGSNEIITEKYDKLKLAKSAKVQESAKVQG